MGQIKHLDTYVLCEIFNGNLKFTHYFDSTFIINELTLAEFYHVLLKRCERTLALQWIKKLLPYTQTVPFRILIKAVDFRSSREKFFIL